MPLSFRAYLFKNFWTRDRAKPSKCTTEPLYQEGHGTLKRSVTWYRGVALRFTFFNLKNDFLLAFPHCPPAASEKHLRHVFANNAHFIHSLVEIWTLLQKGAKLCVLACLAAFLKEAESLPRHPRLPVAVHCKLPWRAVF